MQLDSEGHYTALLGGASPAGLPLDVFTSGTGRWLGVQPGLPGVGEQPRVLLVGVPYAFKAADAETLGGKPASAYVTTETFNEPGSATSASATSTSAGDQNRRTASAGREPKKASSANPLTSCTSVTADGTATANRVAKFTTACTIHQSQIFDNGTNVGVGTTTPGATLDVNGNISGRDNLGLPQTTKSTIGVITLGGSSFVHACCSASAENTFVGVNAGNFTTSGVGHNTATGFKALFANSTGNENTATGYFALAANTNGNSNTAFGHEALQSNTSGFNNTAVGFSALLSNGTGRDNTAVGDSALGSNTKGFQNVAVGESALFAGPGGFNNTAVGFAADSSDGTGSNNTSLGFQAGTLIGGLTNATAIGAFAGAEHSNSIVLGCTLACPNGAAAPNVGIGTNTPAAHLDVTGHGADVFIGDPGCGFNPFAGIGFGSGGFNNCTNYSMVGNGADTFVGAPSGNIFFRTNSNTTTPMLITPSGQVGVGTTAPDNTLTVNGSADKPGGGSWGVFSDGRLKTVAGPYRAGLDAILKLTPVRYRYREGNAMGIRDGEEHVGFVAQDVQKVIPEAVSANSRGYLLVNNDPILWTMLNAIKQQQTQIEALTRSARDKDAQIQKLTEQAQALQKLQLEMAGLKGRLEQVEANSGNSLAFAAIAKQ